MTTLSCERLHFGYPGLPDILADLSLTLHQGEMVGVTGPSGRGKSTLLYLIGLLLPPRSGEVTVNGAPTAELSDAARASLRATVFGFVFQDAALDQSRSVMDNIIEVSLYNDLDPRRARARAKELMERLGVEVPADRRPGQISGGQAQRIALCRALVHHPSVLLADEPTGNLDDASASGVIAALRDHCDAGGLTIVVTHDPRVERVCDSVVTL